MFEKVVGTMPGGGSVTQEEYYGDVFALLKQGEVYLKKVMEMYPNDNTQDELQSILYTKTGKHDGKIKKARIGDRLSYCIGKYS